MVEKKREANFVQRTMVQDVFSTPKDPKATWRKSRFQGLNSPLGMYRVANGMGATKAIKPCAAVLKKQVSSESFDLDSSSDTGRTNIRQCNTLHVKGSITASAAKKKGDLDLEREEKKGFESTDQPRGRVVVIRGSSQKRYSTPGQAAP